MKQTITKSSLLFLIAFGFLGLTFKTPVQPEDEIDQKVKELLSKMSIEEKAGQMTQLTLTPLLKKDANNKVILPEQLDPVLLDSAINYYKVGSILNVNEFTMDLKRWRTIIKQIQDKALKTKNKIPVIYGIDAIHGVNYTVGATLFPHQIAQAATWNPELVQKAYEITAYETRASGIPWNFSPVLDVARTPLWPRVYETYGEDPYLASEMTKVAIRGYQGKDVSKPYNVAACMKHYMGYSMPLSGKDRTPAWIPERYLREYFMPTFATAVKEGAMTIMVNSSEINGIPVHADYHLLTEVLRGELGFKGFAVTDWMDIIYLYTNHKVAKNNRDAVKMSIMAGIDMSMVPYDYSFTKDLISLIKSGEIPMSRIDEAVGRILKVKYQLGLFDKVYYDEKLYKDLGSIESSKVSLATALEAITLLKNDKQTLPLPKSASVLVTGPCAYSLNALNGGWTHTWQGTDTTYNTKGKLTILEAIRKEIGADKVKFIQGSSFDKDVSTKQAAEAAKSVDYAIVCLGEMPYTENPGNIDELALPDAQMNLVKEIAAAGKPVILVLTEGRPRLISKAEPLANGIIHAYLPGNEGGVAIADILFGDVNPSGKLPYSYPRNSNNLITYDHKYNDNIDDSRRYNPQYPFGYGLSYTNFTYSDLKFNKETIGMNEDLEVSVTVANTGKREGKEVVQLFVGDLVASITPSERRLKKFTKVSLQPGESKTVKFTLNKEDLSFIGKENKRITEPGEFKVMVEKLNKNFNLK